LTVHTSSGLLFILPFLSCLLFYLCLYPPPFCRLAILLFSFWFSILSPVHSNPSISYLLFSPAIFFNPAPFLFCLFSPFLILRSLQSSVLAFSILHNFNPASFLECLFSLMLFIYPSFNPTSFLPCPLYDPAFSPILHPSILGPSPFHTCIHTTSFSRMSSFCLALN
jgi:hypothetical protein